jgi:hypothetical protein
MESRKSSMLPWIAVLPSAILAAAVTGRVLAAIAFGTLFFSSSGIPSGGAGLPIFLFLAVSGAPFAFVMVGFGR